MSWAGFAGASWRFPRVEPRFIPDSIHVRDYRTSWGEQRFVVEARQGARVLGDKAFETHADALAFAKMKSGWHAAKLIDHASGARG
jgi:hypothetical protein